jgi:hypothetical protein
MGILITARKGYFSNIINQNLNKMKKIYLLLATSILLLSCSKNSEQINAAKNEVEKTFSEIEKKGIDYNCIEMSDREAYKEIIKYHQNESEKVHNSYEEFGQKHNLGKYRTAPVDEMENTELQSYLKRMNFMQTLSEEESKLLQLASNDIKTLSTLKGNNTYYKISAVKTSPDTIFYKKIYLDNNNKIIITQYLK